VVIEQEGTTAHFSLAGILHHPRPESTPAPHGTTIRHDTGPISVDGEGLDPLVQRNPSWTLDSRTVALTELAGSVSSPAPDLSVAGQSTVVQGTSLDRQRGRDGLHFEVARNHEVSTSNVPLASEHAGLAPRHRNRAGAVLHGKGLPQPGGVFDRFGLGQ